MIWIVEIYTGKKTIPEYVLSSLVNKFPSSTFYPVFGPYGIYYKGKVPEDDKKDVQRFLRKNWLRHQRWYESSWDRNSTYRQAFIQNYSGPMRCRYCNRKITKKNMEVDHLIPVAKAKKGGFARQMLKEKGITNVNDVRNLVPSCRRCNRRKGSKMGLWYIRGALGKYPVYWKIILLSKILLIAIIFVLLIVFGEQYYVLFFNNI